MCLGSCLKVFILSVLVNLVFSHDSETDSATNDVYDIFLNHFGLSPLSKLYKKCRTKDSTMEECISVETVLLLDQIVHKNVVPLSDGIKMVSKKTSSGRSLGNNDILTEEKLEASLPRSIDARQSLLDGIMVDKVSSFINSHTLQISLPEARGLRRQGIKLKKMLLPFLVGVLLKGASLIPVILAGMKVLALKAILASKAALILTSMLGLKKYFHGHHHGHQKYQIHQYDFGMNGGYGHAYGSDLQGIGHRQGEVTHARYLDSLNSNSLQDYSKNENLS